MKVFADDKLSITHNIKSVFHKVEHIVGKEENASYQHSVPFPKMFSHSFFPFGASKLVITLYGVNSDHNKRPKGLRF